MVQCSLHVLKLLNNSIKKGDRTMTYIKQIVATESATDTNLLTENEFVVKIGIHALPGTAFQFNGAGNFVMNHTGNFSMDCSDFPISSIKLITKVNNAGTYPIILDLVCREGVQQ